MRPLPRLLSSSLPRKPSRPAAITVSRPERGARPARLRNQQKKASDERSDIPGPTLTALASGLPEVATRADLIKTAETSAILGLGRTTQQMACLRIVAQDREFGELTRTAGRWVFWPAVEHGGRGPERETGQQQERRAAMSADFRTEHFKGWQHDGYVHVARVDGDRQEYPLDDLTAGEVAELASMISPDPNPLDDRLLTMAAILRETGDEDAADEIEVNAAYVREAWRGSDDRGIADALEIISACAGGNWRRSPAIPWPSPPHSRPTWTHGTRRS